MSKGPSQLMSSSVSECCDDAVFPPTSVLSCAKWVHKWHYASCSILNMWKVGMWLTLKEITVWECWDYGLKSIREDMLRRNVYPFIHWHLGCLHFLAIINNAAVSSHVQAFVWRCFDFSWAYSQEWNCWIWSRYWSSFSEMALNAWHLSTE